MNQSILTERHETVGVVVLNRPEILNAWDAPMRGQLIEALQSFARDDTVRAIVLTGAGDRAFGAGQDLNETRTFDPERAKEWLDEWHRLYDTIRGLTKPFVVALNGLAAGSAFQVALLADMRVGHADARMGQPEIDAGIPSTMGPWIMQSLVGLARTIDLTLTGRLMDGEECHRIGLVNRLVPRERVLAEAIALAAELGAKPPVAMRLNKARFREITEAGFREAVEAGKRVQEEAYGSGEPARMMEHFLRVRAERRSAAGRRQ